MFRFIYFFVLLFIVTSVHAGTFNTKAQSVYLFDYDSGAELVVKNADVLMPPSSMIKLLTLAVLFDEIKTGRISLDDRFKVGENADYQNPLWQPASKICLSAGQSVSVRDLITGLIVLSGGDASVVIAEHLAGTENKFINMMTEKARSIGMDKSTFGNASGLPNPDNLMTSRELGILAKHLIRDYPDLYPMFATKKFEFNDYKTNWCRDWGKTHTSNYNRLLFIMPSADGLKTGHTDEGGYGMVASAKIGKRRLVGIINGFHGSGHEALAQEVKKLLSYGFSTTKNKVFFNANDDILEIPVWYGRKKTVTGTINENLAITVPKSADFDGVRVLSRYYEPVEAPVKQGQVIGEIFVEQNGVVLKKLPLVAKNKVSKIQFFGRVFKNLSVIIMGK